jgi:hypothetical protein
MKRFCAILIVVPLVGSCDKKHDLAACQIEAVRAHPDAKNDRESLKDYSDFVTACLEAKGYTVNKLGQ